MRARKTEGYRIIYILLPICQSAQRTEHIYTHTTLLFNDMTSVSCMSSTVKALMVESVLERAGEESCGESDYRYAQRQEIVRQEE